MICTLILIAGTYVNTCKIERLSPILGTKSCAVFLSGDDGFIAKVTCEKIAGEVKYEAERKN